MFFNKIRSTLILFPLHFIMISEIIFPFSRTFSVALKFASLISMLYVFFNSKYIPIKLSLYSILFISGSILGVLNTFNYYAGIEDLIKYSIPLIMIMYAFSVRKLFNKLFYFFTFYFLLGFVFQIINYIYDLSALQSIYFGSDLVSGVFLRARGFLKGFAGWAFFSYCYFFIVYLFYFGRNRYILMFLALVMLFASLSTKIIFCFCLGILSFSWKKEYLYFSSFFCIIFFFSDIWLQISEFINVRITAYVIGDSVNARTESYRVLKENILQGNFFGRGIGSFGGPASTKYNSPLYSEFNFDWGWMDFLATTDSFYPHLFVELGIIGGLFYLSLFILVFKMLKFKKSKNFYLIVLMGLLLDSIFSFGLNSFVYCLSAFTLVFSIDYRLRIKRIVNIK